MPFNFWFVHILPSGHIDGISGDCDLKNREKSSSSSTCPYGQGAPLSPTIKNDSVPVKTHTQNELLSCCYLYLIKIIFSHLTLELTLDLESPR